ncbi:MAG: hypothetical protein Q9227_004369 [Pyrenula ochraceoflavens]
MSSFYPKTVLVTGIGMAKGLRIARAFYLTGHRVIGADFEPNGVPVSGRFSKSLSRFYTLSKPTFQEGATKYIAELVDITRREKVDLWVSCSGVASAVEDGMAKDILEKKTNCHCIQFNAQATATLHEKDTFIRYTGSLGLPVPETHQVTSRDAVHNVLHKARGNKKYIMKTVGMDDASRADIKTLLPRRTLSQTYSHVSTLQINESLPWVLQQFISGEEYCTHALIINNKIKLFTSCKSSDMLMHYVPLHSSSGLNKAMRRFTEEFARKAASGFTGHLSFDFLVEERITERGVRREILPIECNPRAHTAVVLFQGQGGAKQMTDAYLSVLEPRKTDSKGLELSNGVFEEDQNGLDSIEPEAPTYGVYWIGHDIVSLVLQPLLMFLTLQIGISGLSSNIREFLQHVLFWKEGTYETWDPLPWWWLNHVYWPGMFLETLIQGKRWSRVNVSTTKMFLC